MDEPYVRVGSMDCEAVFERGAAVAVMPNGCSVPVRDVPELLMLPKGTMAPGDEFRANGLAVLEDGW